MHASSALRPAIWLAPLFLLLDLASPSAVPILAVRDDGTSTSPSSTPSLSPTTTSSTSSSSSSSSPSSSSSSTPATITTASTAAAAEGVWVSVDDSGTPHTITPVTTTIAGKETVLSAAPYDVTGTVFTATRDARLTTSTGTAAATATATDGAGAFAACNNLAGTRRPFCAPADNQTLNPGTTYYIIWDPSYFDASNTTIKVVGFFGDNKTDQAFTSGNIDAGWGFYQWTVNSKLLSGKGASGVNITVRIAALSPQSNTNTTTKVWTDGPTVRVARPAIFVPPKAKAPQGKALYIGLPVIFGFVALCLLGTCLWNKKQRRIGLGNIMTRARRMGGRSGYGVNKSRAQRMRTRRASMLKEQRVELMARHKRDEDEQGQARAPNDHHHRHHNPDSMVYHDEPERGGVEEYDRFDFGLTGGGDGGGRGSDDDNGRPRRDSDALGSLVGTPPEDRRMDFGSRAATTGTGTGNIFRDELERQRQERERRL